METDTFVTILRSTVPKKTNAAGYACNSKTTFFPTGTIEKPFLEKYFWKKSHSTRNGSQNCFQTENIYGSEESTIRPNKIISAEKSDID